MRVLISGATGLVGRALVKRLQAQGDEVVALTRSEAKAKEIFPNASIFVWNPELGLVPPPALEGVTAIVHLAGEGIAERRWSKVQKARIYNSRVVGTMNMVRSIHEMEEPPKIFISGSAIGIYGDRKDKIDENSVPGDGFLANLCKHWEEEALGCGKARTCVLRTGIVLSTQGGALRKMLPLFKMGVGGKVGDGKQWMSWIHLEDLVSLVLFLIYSNEARGPVNAVAPEPCTNEEFTKVLGRVLHRPTLIPAPAFALKLALGELASLVVEGQRVYPKRASELGFKFHFPDLQNALSDLLQSCSFSEASESGTSRAVG